MQFESAYSHETFFKQKEEINKNLGRYSKKGTKGYGK